MLRFMRSVGYACKGLFFAMRSQRNLRIQLVAATGVMLLGFWVGLTRLEWLLLLVMMSLVLVGELINTALELILNLMEARHHPVARAAKDVAAGAVFLAGAISVIVGILLFGPRLLRSG